MRVLAIPTAPTHALLLGGRVIAGRRLGRILGVPTANIAVPGCRPKFYGSWAAWTKLGGRARPSLVHLGIRPSVGETEPLLEVHLLDFDGDLYGEHLRVRLLRKISEEVRLETLELLRGKIAEDLFRVRRHFEAIGAIARLSMPGD